MCASLKASCIFRFLIYSFLHNYCIFFSSYSLCIACFVFLYILFFVIIAYSFLHILCILLASFFCMFFYRLIFVSFVGVRGWFYRTVIWRQVGCLRWKLRCVAVYLVYECVCVHVCTYVYMHVCMYTTYILHVHEVHSCVQVHAN